MLTHDVEGTRGLQQVEALAKLESDLGFRSSFNFIPEGEYDTPKALREKLKSSGFEIGVHDLKHDGKLYRSRRQFSEQAKRINAYLKEWGAEGFRSGFMLRNLDWIHSLDIKYDASTFDTDPFEPQPDGVHTIFPFWVAGGCSKGYVELPYTLAQDSTLFLILKEETIGIWKEKLDWIAARGGMALINVHPDYMDFEGDSLSGLAYPASFYKELLEYAMDKYAGRFWNPLPRQIASFVAGERVSSSAASSHVKPSGNKGMTIWIDLDNTPHVPFFEPIIKELERRGFKILLTARDAFQVCELADQRGWKYIKVGRHHGRNPLLKLLGLFYRAVQLFRVVYKFKPVLAVSHGSRAQIILANMLGMPSLLLADYEYAKVLPLMRPKWEMVPEVIPASALHCPARRVLKYPGIKEDVYVPWFTPDAAIKTQLGIESSQIVVTARPPAAEAHYHRPESDILFARFMENACLRTDVKVIMLPRNMKQAKDLRERFPHWFEGKKTIIPEKAVDGLNLLWFSDLVVSGGGTMNREAAALNLPVYSVFRGVIGAVDQSLEQQGKLVLLTNEADVDSKILFRKRSLQTAILGQTSAALLAIADGIEMVATGSGKA